MLQAIVIRGVCGRRMTVRHRQRGANKKIDPDYLCQREGIERGEAPCQRIPGLRCGTLALFALGDHAGDD